MRIGIEAQRLFRKHKHGMDIVAAELIRHLQQIDHENEYTIFVKEDEDSSVITETPNFRIVKIKSAPYPFWEQVLLPEQIKKHHVQLLHCTSNTAPLKISVPLVVTVHDIIYLESLNLTKGTPYQIFGNLYRRWNVPSVLRKAAKIITVSDFEKTQIEKSFSQYADKVEVVHNGVGDHFRMITDQRVLDATRRKYNLPSKFVFYLGNTDPKKNLEGVMRALSYLKSRKKLNFKLLMLDIDRDYLKRMAIRIDDESILNYIEFPGYVPNNDLPAVYSMADVFLYPSIRESFGIPILEAMACGAPVVTSETSAMPEVAGEAAEYINPRNPEAIGDTLTTLLENASLRLDLVEKGLRRISNFSWDSSAHQTLNIYRQVLSEETSGTHLKKIGSANAA